MSEPDDGCGIEQRKLVSGCPDHVVKVTASQLTQRAIGHGLQKPRLESDDDFVALGLGTNDAGDRELVAKVHESVDVVRCHARRSDERVHLVGGPQGGPTSDTEVQRTARVGRSVGRRLADEETPSGGTEPPRNAGIGQEQQRSHRSHQCADHWIPPSCQTLCIEWLAIRQRRGFGDPAWLPPR